MGTLFDQPVRKDLKVSDSSMYDLLSAVKRHASEHDLTVDQVLQAYKIKELERNNNLIVSNGNIYDEQIAGIGEILREMSGSLTEIASEIIIRD
jgi:hypothetical protein